MGQASDKPACESDIRAQGWDYPAAHFNHIGKLKAGKARQCSAWLGEGMKQQITAGETYSVRYPFVRAEFEVPPDDQEATKMATVRGWRPGTKPPIRRT